MIVGKTILLVDDNQDVRERLEGLYRDMGLAVVGVASSGMEAIDLLNRLDTWPDLISLDIVMPEMNGIEAYQIIKAQRPEAKVFFVSVLGSEPRIVKQFEEEIPAGLFVPKRLDAEFLQKKIMGILDEVEETTKVIVPEKARNETETAHQPPPIPIHGSADLDEEDPDEMDPPLLNTGEG